MSYQHMFYTNASQLEDGPVLAGEDRNFYYMTTGYICCPRIMTHFASPFYADLTPRVWIHCSSEPTFMIQHTASTLQALTDIYPEHMEESLEIVTYPHCCLAMSEHPDASALPHIDADDYYDPPESPRKRQEDVQSSSKKNKDNRKRSGNVYRSQEGYLVEEPPDDETTNMPNKKTN